MNKLLKKGQSTALSPKNWLYRLPSEPNTHKPTVETHSVGCCASDLLQKAQIAARGNGNAQVIIMHNANQGRNVLVVDSSLLRPRSNASKPSWESCLGLSQNSRTELILIETERTPESKC